MKFKDVLDRLLFHTSGVALSSFDGVAELLGFHRQKLHQKRCHLLGLTYFGNGVLKWIGWRFQ